jgi:hypothetical protein
MVVARNLHVTRLAFIYNYLGQSPVLMCYMGERVSYHLGKSVWPQSCISTIKLRALMEAIQHIQEYYVPSKVF